MSTADGGEQEEPSPDGGAQEEPSSGGQTTAADGGAEDGTASGGQTTAADLVFRARALAQTHPLTGLASRFINKAVAEQRMDQPVPEIGIWAGGALIDGYCLRRVELEFGGTGATTVVPARQAPHEDSVDAGGEGAQPVGADLAELDVATNAIAADLRRGEMSSYDMAHEELTIAALDRLIASSVERRLDHWRDDIDSKAWDELSEYLTWWVVKGYALRVAEERGPGASVSSPDK